MVQRCERPKLTDYNVEGVGAELAVGRCGAPIEVDGTEATKAPRPVRLSSGRCPHDLR